MHTEPIVEKHALQCHQRIARTKATYDFSKIPGQKYAVMQDHEIAESGLQSETIFLLADLHWRSSNVLPHDADLVEIGEVASRCATQKYLLARDVNFQNTLHYRIQDRGVSWPYRKAKAPAIKIVIGFRRQPCYLL